MVFSLYYNILGFIFHFLLIRRLLGESSEGKKKWPCWLHHFILINRKNQYVIH